MALEKEVSVSVGRETMAGPPLVPLCGHGAGTETERQLRQTRALGRKDTQGSPPPAAPLGSPWGKLPSASPLSLLYSVHGTFANTAIVGGIVGGTQGTQNNSKQVSIMISPTAAVHRRAEPGALAPALPGLGRSCLSDATLAKSRSAQQCLWP